MRWGGGGRKGSREGMWGGAHDLDKVARALVATKLLAVPAVSAHVLTAAHNQTAVVVCKFSTLGFALISDPASRVAIQTCHAFGGGLGIAGRKL